MKSICFEHILIAVAALRAREELGAALFARLAGSTPNDDFDVNGLEFDLIALRQLNPNARERARQGRHDLTGGLGRGRLFVE